MTLEVKKLDNVGADLVFRLLERKHLLTLEVRNNPAILVPAVMGADCYGIYEGDKLAAFLMECRAPQSHILDLTLIPEDKTLCLHGDELARISQELRSRWFVEEGWGKVQASVPKSRKNASRTLLALGFTCETRSCGIRDGITLSKGPEPLMIYGLLPSDPEVTPIMKPEEAHA